METAADLYLVAGDAYEEGRIKEAKKLVLEARELFPEAKVPFRLQDLVPFTAAQVEQDMAVMFPDVDELETGKTKLFDEPSYRVTAGHTYIVMRNEAAAHAAALSAVTEDLKQEPELFNQTFLQQHIDQEALAKYVYEVSLEDDYIDELAEHQPRDFYSYAKQVGIDLPDHVDFDEEPSAKLIDKVRRAYAEEAASNPMDFFSEMYGNEAYAYAIEAAGLDIDSAAAEAVNVDGWAHFLSHYDGNYQTTNAGFVIWRED